MNHLTSNGCTFFLSLRCVESIHLIRLRSDRHTGGASGRNLFANAGDSRDMDSIPGSRGYLGVGKVATHSIFLPGKLHGGAW